MISSQYCGDYRCYNLLLVTWQKRHHCQCHQYLFQLRTVFWRYRCLMESLLVTITLQEHCHCRCDFILELQDYNVNDTQVAKSWFLNFLLARLVFYGQPGQIYICKIWFHIAQGRMAYGGCPVKPIMRPPERETTQFHNFLHFCPPKVALFSRQIHVCNC